MTRLLNFIPTVMAFIAFTLSILCLFSGTKRNLISGADLFTIYTRTLAQYDLGIHDFYSIYVMSYCEGGLVSDGEGQFLHNITSCSHRSPLFSFDPSKVLLREAGAIGSLAEIGWPVSVTDDFRAFRVTRRSLGSFYCIGVGAAGFAILARLWLVITQGPRQSRTEVSSLLLSFTSLSIASIIATVIAFQFVDLINYHGKDSGVTAEYGSQFLGMTWAAVALLLVGSITSLLFLLVDRTRPEPIHQVEEEVKAHSEDESSESGSTKDN